MLEAVVADLPGDEVAAVGDHVGAEIAQRHAGRIGADQGRRSAVGEQQERQHAFEVGGLLHVQRAELEH